MSKILEFREQGEDWNVFAKKFPTLKLGYIRWEENFQHFLFVPDNNTAFSGQALADIYMQIVELELNLEIKKSQRMQDA